MKLKDLLEPEEWFIGAMLQFPLYFIVGWHIIPIMALCGFLWRLGGVSGGFKMARRIGVPFVVCLSTYLVYSKLAIFIAIPFMVLLVPSYGASGWLFRVMFNLTEDDRKADLLCRGITYILYWTSFSLVLIFIK